MTVSTEGSPLAVVRPRFVDAVCLLNFGIGSTGVVQQGLYSGEISGRGPGSFFLGSLGVKGWWLFV